MKQAFLILSNITVLKTMKAFYRASVKGERYLLQLYLTMLYLCCISSTMYDAVERAA